MQRRILINLLCLLPLIACDQNEPVYDADIDLTAIPIEAGSLEGKFALRVRTNAIADLSFLGDLESISDSYWIMQRTYDPETQTYEQAMDFCISVNFEIAGMKTTVLEGTYDRVENTTSTLIINHETGAYESQDILLLFALKNLDDPLTAALPQNEEELEDFLTKDHVYDIDEDGNPGVTLIAQGALNANLFSFSRHIRQLKGITLGPDRLVGLMTNNRYSYVIESDNPLMLAGLKPMPPHPDPKENWFEEIRVGDEVTCGSVLDLVEDGSFTKVRPF